MKGQTYVILAIILTIIIAIFAVINVDSVEVNYLFWTAESPLILVILFSVLMGGIIAAIAGMVKIFHMQKELKQLHLENGKMRKQMEQQGLVPEEVLQENRKVSSEITTEKE